MDRFNYAKVGNCEEPGAKRTRSGIQIPAASKGEPHEMNPTLLQSVQNAKFCGSPNEDPMDHLDTFDRLCKIYKPYGVSMDVIRLLTFPFSLGKEAARWEREIPASLVTTWRDVEQEFLDFFYPRYKTAKLRTDLLNFQQEAFESLSESWQRLKGCIRTCPHHGFSMSTILGTFYRGCRKDCRELLDSTRSGSFINMDVWRGERLIEKLTTSHVIEDPEDDLNRKELMRIDRSDQNITINHHFAVRSRSINAMRSINPEKRKRSSAASKQAELFEIKEMLGSVMRVQETNRHEINQEFCGMEYKINLKVDNLSGKFNKLHSVVNELNYQVENLHTLSEVYHEKKPHEDFCQFLEGANKDILNSKPPQISNLKVAEETKYDRSEESDESVLRNEKLNSGIERENVHGEEQSFSTLEIHDKELTGKDYERAMEVLKILKDSTSKSYGEDKEKSRVEEGYSKPVSSMVNKGSGDPGAFTITCSIGDYQLNDCILDSGASASVIPLKTAKALGMTGIREATSSLVLGNGTTCEPAGVIDDVPVRLKGHIFNTTFLIVDTKNDAASKVILGRPFLSATEAEIFVKKGRVDFYLGPNKFKHQVWRKKPSRPVQKNETMNLKECQFMQEIDDPGITRCSHVIHQVWQQPLLGLIAN